jgi:hypothetical protein
MTTANVTKAAKGDARPHAASDWIDPESLETPGSGAGGPQNVDVDTTAVDIDVMAVDQYIDQNIDIDVVVDTVNIDVVVDIDINTDPGKPAPTPPTRGQPPRTGR